MALADEIFQRVPLKIIRHGLTRGKVAHSYLFYGPPGSGKERAAFAFARALNCLRGDSDFCGTCAQCVKIDHFNHPDIHYLFPMPSGIKEEEISKIIMEKREDRDAVIRFSRLSIISIEHIRMLQRELQLKAFDSPAKFVIVRDAEKMGEEAANAFLKTLEEPPAESVIVLITANISSLLPTIVSRCARLYFRPLTPEEMIRRLTLAGEVEDERLRSAVAFSDGNISRAREMLRGDFFEERCIANDLLENAYHGEMIAALERIDSLSLTRDLDRVREFLTVYLLWFRDLLSMAEGSSTAHLINRDRLDDLEGHLRYHSRHGLMKALEDVESYRRAVGGNVNLSLVLTVFLVRLQAGEYA